MSNRPIPPPTDLLLASLIALSLLSGCVTQRYAEQRSEPTNPLTQQLSLDAKTGPRPTQRTLQTLRRFNLEAKLAGDPRELVEQMQQLANSEPTADTVYALAEVAYVGAVRAADNEQPAAALDLYCTAVVNAYFYLFDHTFGTDRSPFDPRFRRACDLYNNALENTMRLAMELDRVRPGGSFVIQTPYQEFEFSCADRGTCHGRALADLKFVSDFEIKELTSRFRTFGLGVSMIALYRPHDNPTAVERFYPPGASFPVTAFLRVIDSQPPAEGSHRTRYRCAVELHDTTRTSEIEIGGVVVPLESDLTTPLAYLLDNPAFRRANVPTKGLLDPGESAAVSGLYMLEPYDPNKIPVLMVHGFWSSLVTWMEMFNELLGADEIRDNYQFWFYLYPTGQPLWFSAARLRSELADIRSLLDPQHRYAALDQMVIVGHSMGGLLAKMQTIESGNDFWSMLSAQPLDQLVATPELKASLTQAMYFHANPSVKRVVTIATPHRGSNFSNLTTQWLGRKLINMPSELKQVREKVLRDNPGYFPEISLVHYTTSVEALSPDSPILPAIREAQHAPWIKYHNIVGLIDETPMLRAVTTATDGVVSQSSAHSDEAVTEIVVNAPHTKVHQHPAAILEVRRILLQHLNEVRANQSPTHNPRLRLTSARTLRSASAIR